MSAPDAPADLVTEGLPGLDLTTFARWYDAQRPGDLAGPPTGRLVSGGRSNLTYEVTDGERWLIVRRPPLGHVQATAHDMGREFRVMSALAGTPVPVPTTFAHCEDPEVLGSPFYVMQRVEGTPYRRADQLATLGPERTRTISTAMVDVLADLHAVDPAAVGLDGFGRPAGFLARQVKRWGQQLEGSTSRPLPDGERLRDALAERVPATDAAAERAGIVHGDYRLDNLLVGADDAVAAVVDWEMATLGDVLTDLALLVVYDRLADLGAGSVVTDASRAPGFLTADEQLTRYAARSGRDLAADGLSFHLGLAHFKLAVILEGIHFRFLQGGTVGEGFDEIGEAVAPLLAAGLAALHDD